MKKTLLLNPGPTNVSEEVRRAIKTQDICHREQEFFDVLSSVREKVLKAVNGEGTHTAIAFISSATGCNEAVISSIRGKVLVINNGKYSERLRKIVQTYKIPFIEMKVNPYAQIDVKEVEKILKNNPAITHIVFVHHETTTGLLLPLNELGKLAKKYKKILFADTVSSFGGYKIDVKADHLSFCTVSANKCLESFPGISFVVAEKAKLKLIKDKSRSFYFDLYAQWEAEEKKGQLPFTPAVQLFFALDKALEELMEEGIPKRIQRYKKNAKIMRQGLKSLGFEFILSEKLLQNSNIVTAIRLPKTLDYWKLHDALKEKGYTIYSGEKTLAEGIFRIATLGHLSEKDIHKFLKDLARILKKMNFQKGKVKNA